MTRSNHKANTKLKGMEIQIWGTVSEVKRRLIFI